RVPHASASGRLQRSFHPLGCDHRDRRGHGEGDRTAGDRPSPQRQARPRQGTETDDRPAHVPAAGLPHRAPRGSDRRRLPSGAGVEGQGVPYLMLRSTLQTLRRLPPQLQALFVTTLIFRAGTMAFPFLSAYLIGNGGLSAGEAGAIVGAYGVGALLADLAAGPLLRLAGGHTVMVAGLISNGVLVAVMPFLEGAFLLLVATVVWGFCYETFTPASYTTIVQNCDESIRKVAFSAHRLAINLGMAVGPAVGGLLY